MREAAVLGSVHAQYFLGHRYETGKDVPRDPDRARRYYRQCASRGEKECQYRLGMLFLHAPNRREYEYLQALAFLQLAAEQNVPQATQIVARESSKLTGEQSGWDTRIKAQIVQKSPVL
jgi:TPR repeat protein